MKRAFDASGGKLATPEEEIRQPCGPLSTSTEGSRR